MSRDAGPSKTRRLGDHVGHGFGRGAVAGSPANDFEARDETLELRNRVGCEVHEQMPVGRRDFDTGQNEDLAGVLLRVVDARLGVCDAVVVRDREDTDPGLDGLVDDRLRRRQGVPHVMGTAERVDMKIGVKELRPVRDLSEIIRCDHRPVHVGRAVPQACQRRH